MYLFPSSLSFLPSSHPEATIAFVHPIIVPWKCMDKHPYAQCLEAHSYTCVFVCKGGSVSRMLLGHHESAVTWPHFSPGWLCQLMVYMTISASPRPQSCLLLIFKMHCRSDACEMVSHSRICVFIINEIKHLCLCLLATCVSSSLNRLFTFFAVASIVLSFFLLVVVVHCVFWLLILYQSLCRDHLQVSCLSFTLFMVYVYVQTSLILM